MVGRPSFGIQRLIEEQHTFHLPNHSPIEFRGPNKVEHVGERRRRQRLVARGEKDDLPRVVLYGSSPAGVDSGSASADKIDAGRDGAKMGRRPRWIAPLAAARTPCSSCRRSATSRRARASRRRDNLRVADGPPHASSWMPRASRLPASLQHSWPEMEPGGTTMHGRLFAKAFLLSPKNSIFFPRFLVTSNHAWSIKYKRK